MSRYQLSYLSGWGHDWWIPWGFYTRHLQVALDQALLERRSLARLLSIDMHSPLL